MMCTHWEEHGQPLCAAGSNMVRTTVRFDTGEPWHTDSSCMVPANSFDSRSIATHEFGHSAALRHSTAWGNPTMRSYSTRGDCDLRSLESDDQNGLNAQYP